MRKLGLAMRTILSWVGTVLFAVAFGLTLLVFDVIMRITFLFGRTPSDYVMGALQSVLIADMRLAGIRVEVERSPNIKPRTSYIIVSNHQSMFDIPVFGWQFFTNFPKYISKLELAKWIPSVISVQLRRGGHALIDRKEPRERRQGDPQARARGGRVRLLGGDLPRARGRAAASSDRSSRSGP